MKKKLGSNYKIFIFSLAVLISIILVISLESPLLLDGGDGDNTNSSEAILISKQADSDLAERKLNWYIYVNSSDVTSLSFEEFNAKWDTNADNFRDKILKKTEDTVNQAYKDHLYVEGRGFVSPRQLANLRNRGYTVINNKLVRI